MRTATCCAVRQARRLVAVVSDSYDIYQAIREYWGDTLREEVIPPVPR